MVIDSGLYRNKFRVATTRLQKWDYSSPGYYFVTICCFEKYCYFGEILENKIILSPIGKIIEKLWLEIPRHFKNVILDDYSVMPNHLYGIIKLTGDHVLCRDVRSNVSTENNTQNFYSNISPKRDSLSMIIRLYKSSVKQSCQKQNLSFFWQSRFYEHIIKSHQTLKNIRLYIKNNPLNWRNDEENIININHL